MTEKHTTVLVTGANRGIGRGLAEVYLARPNHTVVAAVRDPAGASATSLAGAAAARGSRLLLVKLDSKADADAAAAVATLRATGVEALDIVVANAGVAPPPAKLDGASLDGASLDGLRDAFDVNAVAPLALFQAVAPLLRAAAAEPRFVVVSTAISSIQNIAAVSAYGLATYGASKAAVNYLVRQISLENPWLDAFVMHPGFVQTDMGNTGARLMGMEKASQTIEESAGGIIKKLDTATIETTSGGFYSWDGSELQF